jgi:putative aldouronate transport system substrate-binding protein
MNRIKLQTVYFAVFFLLALLGGWLYFFPGSGDPYRGAEAVTADSSVSSNDKLTYKVYRNFKAPDYPADGGPGKSLILAEMAKAGITGVDYQVEITPGREYYTKLNFKLAMNDLPDLFTVDYPTFIRLAHNGQLLPLNDLLDASPNLTRWIEPSRFKYVTVDGNIYAIPRGNRPEPYSSGNQEGFMVRKDWLDKLGLPVPQTLDQMYEVLKAFVNDDPDGDGKKDTYGYGAAKGHEFTGIFGAFGINPKFWHERNGKIMKGFVLPETKQVLAILRKWYREGLIDPYFMVTESKQRDVNIVRSKVGLFQNSPLELDPNTPLLSALLNNEPTARLAFFTGVKGPQGKSGFPEATPLKELRAVSSKVKSPEKLFQMLDWMLNDNGGYNLIHYGVEGTDFNLDQATHSILLKSTYPELYRKGFSNPVRFVNVVDVRWAKEEVKQNLIKASRDVIHNELWALVPAEIEYSDLEINLWNEYMLKIIDGEYDLDKWDEFVKKYYEGGGATIEQQANAEWKKLKSAR